MVISGDRRVNLRRLVIRELAHRRLVVVTGKGGVGKTTVAAALALASARSGQRTLVCEVSGKERIAPLLGRAEVGTEVTSLEQNLWAVNVRPQEALREYALMTLKFESIYSAVFENRLVRYFLRFIPSLQELVLLGKILFHAKETRPDGSPRFDKIVVDAPATGHAISFLSVPQVLLDTVPPGALATDARWMRDLLTDPATTGAVLVSLPEELPVNETLELHAALRTKVKVTPALIVLNGFVEERFSAEDLAALPEPVHATAKGHAARAELSAQCRLKLEAIGTPLVTLPRLFTSPLDRAACEALGRAFLAGKAP